MSLPELRFDVRREALGAYADRFVGLQRDEELQAYLAGAPRRRHGWLKTRLQRLLTSFVSDFDANGWLGCYPMYLLGTAQLGELLAGAPSRQRVLDVGAGSGDVTGKLRPLFEQVVTTERSAGMARRLRRQGYECHQLDVAEAGIPEGPWPVITCFNVLDRCPAPGALLAALAGGLMNGGLLCLSLPLPYDPFFYDGARTPLPAAPLPLAGQPFEAAAATLCAACVEPLGLRVTRLARAPYLSGGDAHAPLYTLDSLLLVACADRST